MSQTTAPRGESPLPASLPATRPVPHQRRSSLAAQGEPMLWMTGGALAIALCMIGGLIGLIVWFGMGTFWPQPVVRIKTLGGKVYLGEIARQEDYRPAAQAFDVLPPKERSAVQERIKHSGGLVRRRLLRTGNFDFERKKPGGQRFYWVSDFEVAEEDRPEWAFVFERLTWGPFFGIPLAFVEDGEDVTTDPADILARFRRIHPVVRQRHEEQVRLEREDLGAVARKVEAARLAVRQAELSSDAGSQRTLAARENLARVEEWAANERDRFTQARDALVAKNARYGIRMQMSDGSQTVLPLASIVRGYPANQLTFWQRLEVYLSRWWEYLSARPREANMEGGVFPAIWGTVVMTLLMSVAVVPFGVLAALYMREYAKGGLVLSAVRIAVNNLAGVPSVVFGVFGLGFFCYIVGAGIDQFFFPAELPNPTFGKGGLLWASLTLALLTLPVVIVSTEEALAAVAGSLREGSYACGASKWQTIRRIVLPHALPGIMTGVILSMARGAGEVAPLMLVGAVKLAPDLPVDSVFPYIHPQRSFLHLGFHIYDVGFQSPDSEAARPMVFTTTLLLIVIVAVLNLMAIWLRARLRRRFLVSQF